MTLLAPLWEIGEVLLTFRFFKFSQDVYDWKV